MNYQFAIFRIVLGSYLVWHFLTLLPYGCELFSVEGLISDPQLNPTAPLTPGFLRSPGMVTTFLLAGIAASLSFTLGFLRRGMALFLWALLTCLFLRNNLIANPSMPYVGLALLLSSLIPKGEPLSLSKRDDEWNMPPHLTTVAMILLALGYSFSGWTKLSSASWIDGSAFRLILENPLARPGFIRDFVLSLPDGILNIATWGALTAELLFLPLALSHKTRPWIWLTLLLMHLSLILLIDFADLSLGMVMIHLFTFDPKWLPAPRRMAKVYFDGDCLMCNRFIHFLAEQDQAQSLTFGVLSKEEPQDSIVVIRDGSRFTRSSAILVIFETLGGHWQALALCCKFIPRALRDLLYRVIAKHRHRIASGKACPLPNKAVLSRILPLLLISLSILTSCSQKPLHKGSLPFSLMDRSPGGNHLKKNDAAFREITRFTPGDSPPEIKNGDVLAFHMSHRDAWKHLGKRKIQKLPYELFSFGHLALAIDGQLLQLAMNQTVNTDSDFNYLIDKNWILYRPTSNLDEVKLREFIATARTKKYDYPGLLGLSRTKLTPKTLDDVSPKYTCVTVVQAALHYAGHPMRVSNRKGILDVITPAQLVRSAKRQPQQASQQPPNL